MDSILTILIMIRVVLLLIGGVGDGGEEDGVCMMITLTLIVIMTAMDSVMIAHMDQEETNAV